VENIDIFRSLEYKNKIDNMLNRISPHPKVGDQRGNSKPNFLKTPMTGMFYLKSHCYNLNLEVFKQKYDQIFP
jgi:hypothetical protein